MVSVVTLELPDDDFAIEQDSSLLPLVHELHRNHFIDPFDNDSNDPEADSENACIDPEQAPVQIWIDGTPNLDNRLVGKHISNDYFDIFDYEIDLCSPLSRKAAYRLVHWCFKHNLSRSAINELFRNPTMATVSNLTASHTVFKWLNEMSYGMVVNCSKSGAAC